MLGDDRVQVTQAQHRVEFGFVQDQFVEGLAVGADADQARADGLAGGPVFRLHVPVERHRGHHSGRGRGEDLVYGA
ncbi:hypothetical protein ACFZAU_41445 [Streptomyces sp. NPDC008238]